MFYLSCHIDVLSRNTCELLIVSLISSSLLQYLLTVGSYIMLRYLSDGRKCTSLHRSVAPFMQTEISFCYNWTGRRRWRAGGKEHLPCSVGGWFNCHDDVAVSLTTPSSRLINRYSSVQPSPVMSCPCRAPTATLT